MSQQPDLRASEIVGHLSLRHLKLSPSRAQTRLTVALLSQWYCSSRALWQHRCMGVELVSLPPDKARVYGVIH